MKWCSRAAINGNADALATFNRRDFGNIPGASGSQFYHPKRP